MTDQLAAASPRGASAASEIRRTVRGTSDTLHRAQGRDLFEGSQGFGIFMKCSAKTRRPLAEGAGDHAFERAVTVEQLRGRLLAHSFCTR
jgi:hypothetical protein